MDYVCGVSHTFKRVRVHNVNEENMMDPRSLEKNQAKRRRKKKWKAFSTVINRIFGFFLVTAIMVGIAGLLVLASIVGGEAVGLPEAKSPALKNTFVATMLETRRFKFVPRIFLTEAEVKEIDAGRTPVLNEVMDPTLIHVPSDEEYYASLSPEELQAQLQQQGKNLAYYIDEDGDGYILAPVKGKGYNGYMLIILDPTRVFVAQGGEGQTINYIAEHYGAIGGINGGAFVDEDGTGTGREPEGMTWIDGRLVEDGRYARESFVGLDDEGILHVGYFNYKDALDRKIVGGVSFEPPLIINGVPQDTTYMHSSINPRSAIGQRADGAILMLVIDGRQLSSAGATYEDLVNIMLEFDAVNACNLDGGSSTVMYLNGDLVNSPSSASGYSRGLPNAFLFR